MKKKIQLSPEEKTLRAERLALAREKRYEKNPPKYTQYCADVVGLPDDHPYSFKNVREWLKEATSLKSAAKNDIRHDLKGARAKYEMWNGYVGQLETYLKHGGIKTVEKCGPRRWITTSVVTMACHQDLLLSKPLWIQNQSRRRKRSVS